MQRFIPPKGSVAERAVKSALNSKAPNRSKPSTSSGSLFAPPKGSVAEHFVKQSLGSKYDMRGSKPKAKSKSDANSLRPKHNQHVEPKAAELSKIKSENKKLLKENTEAKTLLAQTTQNLAEATDTILAKDAQIKGLSPADHKVIVNKNGGTYLKKVMNFLKGSKNNGDN